MIFIIVASCSDDPSSIGMDILPKGEILEVGVYEENIKLINIESNRLRTDGPTENSFGIVGYFRDERIGRTIADFFTEVSIPAVYEEFNKYKDKDTVIYTADSLVFSLAYSNNAWYGDSAQNINLKIYEINERLSFANKYYSDNSMDYNDVILASMEVNPKSGVSDSLWSTSNFEKVLRFNFNNSYRNYIENISHNNALRDTLFNIAKDSLTSREAFKNVLKGFYITCGMPPDTIDPFGALFKMNLRSENSFLRLFYKKELIDKITHVSYGFERDSFTFPINRESRMFNRFTHDYSTNNEVILNDHNAPRIFIQGMAGIIAEMDFDDLINEWRKKINEKENFDYGFSGITLEFWVDLVLPTQGLYQERQPYLAIYEEDETGNYTFPTFTNKYGNSAPCYYSINSSGDAVSYSTYSSSTKTFTFRIQPEYFDQLVRPNKDGQYAEIKPLYLRSLSPEFDFRQQIICNTNDPEKGQKPRITVKYVKYR